jgi:hypothetical protein
MFRDQTQEIEQKSRLGAVSQSCSTDSTSFATASRSHLIRSLSPEATELAFPLFFHYFNVDDIDTGHALLSCLPQTISMAEDDALSAAVLAVGYSILANTTNSADRLVMARQKYGIAVRLTYNALHTSVPSETCQIVRTIVLLALFEVSSPRFAVHNLRCQIWETLIP